MFLAEVAPKSVHHDAVDFLALPDAVTTANCIDTACAHADTRTNAHAL